MDQKAEPSIVVCKTAMGPVAGIDDRGVQSFRRLRYAASPVAERRFALPQPIDKWDDALDCTDAGPIPPQHASRLEKVMGSYPARQDEDCLHLDIWRPNSCGPGAPVLVFLHGGAFMTGGGSTACYDGANLARETGMIVINVSYRLGALGFLPLEGIAPANLGLHDQIAAIRFISEIAESIGGDPQNITVAGQSAGAYTIALMLADQQVRSLFAKAIMMSAPLGLHLASADAQQDLAADFLALLGVATGDRGEICRMPVGKLLAAQLEIMRANMPVQGKVDPPFGPLIDGQLVFQEPLESIWKSGAPANDFIIGTTREEMAAFYFENPALAEAAPQIVSDRFMDRYAGEAELQIHQAMAHRAPSGSLELLCDLESDELFNAPTFDALDRQTKHGGRCYHYSFDWQSPRPEIGACHCIDLPFLFGNPDFFSSAPMVADARNDEQHDLGRIFRGALASFARTGDPNGSGLPAWPQYGETRATLHFDRKTSASIAIRSKGRL